MQITLDLTATEIMVLRDVVKTAIYGATGDSLQSKLQEAFNRAADAELAAMSPIHRAMAEREQGIIKDSLLTNSLENVPLPLVASDWEYKGKRS